MKLKISVTKEGGLELYITRNESNDRIYVMRERYLFLKKELQLYDGHKKYIAEIITPIFSAKKLTFKEHDRVIDELVLISKQIKREYQLEQNKWRIEVDVTFTEYNIYDENNELIAETKFNLPDRTWLIDVKKTKNPTLLMLMLLSVVAISQS